jgi:16S rRNA processing protein RimM
VPQGDGLGHPPLVALGVITKPHGVRGQVRVRPHNPATATLGSLDAVTLRAPDGSLRQLGVEAVGGTADAPILTLTGVHDRDAADALRGSEVCVPRPALPPPGPDEWYVADLIGLKVRDAQGTVLGEVQDVASYPSIDCLRVRSADGVREVPMVEPWLVSVDLAAGEVRVGPWHDLPVERA